MKHARRQALIIGRVGDGSLHGSWIAGVRDEDRVFDLHLSYYGDRAEPFGDPGATFTLTHDPGAKFPGLSACLTKLEPRLDAYRWVCFVDDDVWAPYATWQRFFQIVDMMQPSLAQPALKRGSFYSHDITLERPNYLGRWTNFVEIMNFCFSVDFLRQMRGTFDQNASGWGVDYLWAQNAAPKERSLAIIDQAPVLHTRAVGRGGLYDVIAGGLKAAHADHAALDIARPDPMAYAALLHDGSLRADPAINRRLYIPSRVKKLRKMLKIYSIRPPA